MTIAASASEKWRDDTLATARLIMPDVLTKERELTTRKWFDYRFMTPLAATMHFARLYRSGLQDHVRTITDLGLAKNVRGVSIRVPNEPSTTFTQLWLARQKADELSVPYEIVIRFAFEFASRRKRNCPPRPIQLFANPKTEVAWQSQFEKYREGHLPLAIERSAGLPQYRVEHFKALPAQIAFRSFILDYSTSMIGDWSSKIRRECVEKRYLPVWDLMRLVPRHIRHSVVDDIRHDMRLGMLSIAPKETLPGIAFAPGCLGLPPAREATSPECSGCPFAERCERICAGVNGELIKQHGAASPVADRRLMNTRQKTLARVRKHRAKKTALSSTLSGTSA